MKKTKSAVRGSTKGQPIMRLLDTIGKRWSLRVLWELRDCRLSFRELRVRCDDVSPSSLNVRLKELRALSLVDLTDEGYGYTPWGEELGRQLLDLNQWAGKWDKETSPTTISAVKKTRSLPTRKKAPLK